MISGSSMRADLVHTAPIKNAMMQYTIVLQPMACSVPFGIFSAGFFNSPLMLAPAIMPVTAGKKMANTDPQLNDP